MFGPSRRDLYRELARREQAWAIERAALLDRIMHLSGQTWTPPPLAVDEVDEIEVEREPPVELAWDGSHLEGGYTQEDIRVDTMRPREPSGSF